MSDKKLLLVGAGGFGRMASEQARLQYECAFVDDGQAVGTKVCGIPVVGRILDLSTLRSKYDFLVVCIGNNKFRMQIYETAKELGYAFPNACIQSGSTVGDGALINAGTEVHCDAKVGDYTLIYTNSVIRTGASVGKFARIGSNATVCNNAVVPSEADVPDCTAVR